MCSFLAPSCCRRSETTTAISRRPRCSAIWSAASLWRRCISLFRLVVRNCSDPIAPVDHLQVIGGLWMRDAQFSFSSVKAVSDHSNFVQLSCLNMVAKKVRFPRQLSLRSETSDGSFRRRPPTPCSCVRPLCEVRSAMARLQRNTQWFCASMVVENAHGDARAWLWK